MVQATIITTEPSLLPTNSIFLTTAPAISNLNSGTRACAIVVGESPDRHDLIRRDERLKTFKINLAQRELIVEVCDLTLDVHDQVTDKSKQSYRLLGNKRPSNSDENTIIGRGAFYEHFLLNEEIHVLLKKFISDCWVL
jgi:hypothetical protein